MSKIREFIIESKKHGKHTILIDEEDWEKVSQHKWCIDATARRNSRGGFYAKTSILHPDGGWYDNPTSGRGRRRTSMFLHRFLMNPPPGYMVDHINHNGLDNRRENLRICTRVENGRNRLPSKKTASGYKGVRRNGSDNCWQAKINIDKKQTYIGSFATAEEAALAYDKVAIKEHGEFACLNFPEKYNRKESK